jgi:hypothetical protein
VYAGSNVYTTEISNTYPLVGGYQRLEVELTCEVTTVLRIEVQDTNSCFTTVSGYKGVYIDNVCAVRLTNVTNPTGESLLKKFIDPAEVPLQLNKKDYNTVLQSYQDCLARKGTTLYNKISGGVKCDDRELQKLKLIIGLLNQKDEDRSLDCIYDRASVITAVYQELPTGSIGTLTEGDTEIVVDGDLSTFETFIFHITAPVDFSTTIVDAVYDSVTDTTTIILGDEIPSNIVGASYTIEFESENDNTYLKTFTDFANRFCADCIGTGYPSRVTTPTTSTPEQFEIQPTELKTESGIPITTEYNQKITI